MYSVLVNSIASVQGDPPDHAPGEHVQRGPPVPIEHDAAVRGDWHHGPGSFDRSAVDGDHEGLVATEHRRPHFGKPWEFVLGAGAAAVLLSSEPSLLEIEVGRCGYWTTEISDLTRPTSTVETGNSECRAAKINGR